MLPEFIESLEKMERNENKGRPIETFVIVRAVNLDSPQYFSDAGVGLVIRAPLVKQNIQPLAFTSPLYRFVVKENAPPRTVLNSENIGILDSEKHSSVQLRLNDGEFSEYFEVLKNGSLITRRPIDLELLPNQSNGIVDLTVGSGGNDLNKLII